MSRPRSRLALACAAVLLYFLLIGCFQRWSGASGAAFGAYPDEPSHYLSGLLIHDYCVSGLPARPLAFASGYYTHMPFFAIGYWPPFFYFLEAAWMTLFGWHRAAVLLLPGLMAALLSGTIFWLLADRIGIPAAFLTGCLFLLTPALLLSNSLVMVDTTFALLCFWAALAFGQWIDTGSFRAALLAGLWTALALLTKINSIYLLLLLPLVFLRAGHRRPSSLRTFWVIPAVVAILWGPWILYTRKLTNVGFGGLVRPDVSQIAAGLAGALLINLGWMLILVVTGAVIAIQRARTDTSALICAVLPICYIVFLLAARVEIEGRFLIPILAPSAVLAGIAIGALAERWSPKPLSVRWMAALISALVIGSYAASAASKFRRASPNQVRAVVEFIRARGAPDDASILAPSEAEGPFIAEFAADEKRRPLRFMVRPNKLLAIVDWNGGFYQSRYRTAEEMVDLFDKLPLRYTVISNQMNSSTRLHDRLLLDALNTHPERWRRLDSPPARWLVYERIDGRSVEPAQMTAILRQSLTDRLPGSVPGSPKPQ